MNYCIKCGSPTHGSLSYCGNCIKNDWESYSGFIKPKHDPTFLPFRLPSYRSVVTMDFITDKQLFIAAIVDNGTFYQDKKHNNICCILNKAIGNVSGSAIPANYDWPTFPLDSIIVVNAFVDPHVFAIDYSDVSKRISNNTYLPIG